ncbi:hypothetical protein Daus18300_013814 [Diaporthe australafricana]|uniref:Uncharacterized protein n=1 Tax=Diaporthe australafricana TaxID=127596 RepID=A0ABR3VXM9_9PEZI
MESPDIVNLLSLPIPDRSLSLRKKWPHPLDESLTGHGGVKWTAEEKAALDIAVLVVRAVNGQCDPLDPSLDVDAAAMEERRKCQNSALVHYSWHNTPHQATEDVLKLQRQFCQAVLGGKAKLTFQRLIESPAMAKFVWSRRELQLWSEKAYGLKKGDPKWTVQEVVSIPAVYGQSEVQGPASDVAVQEQLAYRSLLRWNWDGKTQLDEFLTSRNRLEWSSTDGTVRYRCPRTWPRCLRIRYDPGRIEGAPGFAELARMTVGKDKKLMAYRILAVVRLGSHGLKDFVRVYDDDCRDARPMATLTLGLHYIDNEWSLGEAGSSYMLYFIKCDTDHVPSLPPKEVVLHSLPDANRAVQVMAMQHVGSGEDGTKPLPYETIMLKAPRGPSLKDSFHDPRPSRRSLSHKDRTSVVVGSEGRSDFTPTDQGPSSSKRSIDEGENVRDRVRKRLKDQGNYNELYYGRR